MMVLTFLIWKDPAILPYKDLIETAGEVLGKIPKIVEKDPLNPSIRNISGGFALSKMD